MKWGIAIGVAIAALVAWWVLQPSPWTVQTHPSLQSATRLVDTNRLPGVLPQDSQNIVATFNAATEEAFFIAQSSEQSAAELRGKLIPVGRATAVELALRHPESLADWEEVSLSARLRTGALVPLRLRDGSRWYLVFEEGGQIRGWHAPDVEPAPAR